MRSTGDGIPTDMSTGLHQLLRPFAGWIVLSAVAGAFAGAATVALLAQINELLNRPEALAGGLLLAFAGLCALSLAGRAVSDIATNHVGQQLVAQVRKSLARKILAAPIDALERYRTHRLIPVLTQDVDMISDVAFMLSSLAIALAVALGCLCYLALLSPTMFGLLALALGLGAAAQYVAQARGIAGFWKARDGEEALHKAYRGISEGAKELRMHRGRRSRMLDEKIERSVEDIRTVNRRAINTYVLASSFGSALFFLLIALVLGWAARSRPEPGVLSGFVLVLLYLKGPVDQIMGALPGIGRARVAFRRIADLSAQFSTPEPHLERRSGQTEPAQLQEAIELRGVSYLFPAGEGNDTGAQAFALGPVDLRIGKGEIVFIVGGNGSGKTTLIKLLLGLYVPQQGHVLLDGQPVTAQNRDDYRQLFTTVFSDFHLFEDLIGQSLTDEAEPYLQRLEIAHKVAVKGGVFSTTDLSTGQRKRLALVHAYLEGRPVLVFDEWAADQDPAFRKVFYTELLPELRAKGRTLIVISHDEQYFHVADRVLHMLEGRMVEDAT